MKLFRAAALMTAALMCGATGALAATGDAPAGWSLVGSETVRYFVPGSTPPAGADLADAATAAKITNPNPSSGEWLLVGSDNVKDFIPDSAGGSNDQLMSSTFVGTRNEQQQYYAGRSKLSGEPTYDAAVWETDTKKWRLVSQTSTVRRYDVPVYTNVHTPYKIVDRYGYDTRTVDTYDNTYRANRIVNTALGQEIVDTHTYTKREEKATAWARQAVDASMDKVISTGIDDTVKTTTQAYVVDLLAGQVAASDKSQGNKSTSFLSDAGTGNNKTALSGSKKRVAFKADEAVASASKSKDKGGSITETVDTSRSNNAAANASSNATSNATSNAASNSRVADAAQEALTVDDVVGTWKLKGGSESYLNISKAREKDKITVQFTMKTVFGTYSNSWTGKYKDGWSVDKEGVKVSGQLNSDGTKLYVTTAGKRFSVTSTFVKQ